jgi:two-component system, LytTR family, response regulator LytT
MTSCILVVEDELIIAENIRAILRAGGYENVLLAEDADSAISLLDVSDIALVVTDIALGEGKTGIDLGEIIRSKYKLPIIYITSHASAEIVSKAKHTRPNAYIVKPFKKEDVLVAAELALFAAGAPEQTGDLLVIKDGRSTLRLHYDEIRWIESNGNYVTFHLAGDRRNVIRQALATLQEQLPAGDFIRIHKSYVVNCKHVHEIRAGIVLVGDRELPVGRSYQEKVAKLFR